MCAFGRLPVRFEPRALKGRRFSDLGEVDEHPPEGAFDALRSGAAVPERAQPEAGAGTMDIGPNGLVRCGAAGRHHRAARGDRIVRAGGCPCRDDETKCTHDEMKWEMIAV